MRRFFIFLLLGMILGGSALNAMTLDRFAAELKLRQSRILTFQALMETTMTSQILGAPLKQTARFYKKSGRVRIESLTPTKQTLIYNANGVFMITAQGQRIAMPPEAAVQGVETLDPLKYLEKFEVAITENASEWLINGIPKSSFSGFKNIGSIVFYVRKTDYSVTKLVMKKTDGSDMLVASMTYVQQNDLPVMKSMVSVVDMNDQKMFIDVTYSAIQINQGLDDALFE